MRQRAPFWILLTVVLLLPACSSDTEMLGPQTPPVQKTETVKSDDAGDPGHGPHKENGRLSRYAMAAS